MAFRDHANGVKYLVNITSHVGFPMNISGENITKPGEVLKCPKNSQN